MTNASLRGLFALVSAALLASCTDGAPASSVAVDASATDITAEVDAPACAQGELRCDGQCVAAASSAAHCGACGRRCAETERCEAGRCVLACAAGESPCEVGDAGPSCANLMTDRRHCGACGRACGEDRVCADGACALMCRPEHRECTRSGEAGVERYCADPMSDARNCGACGSACPAGHGCEAGRCRLRCEELHTACPDTGADAGASERCVNTSADPENCGACGNACAFGQRCVGGRCVTSCGVGLRDCAGVCRDLQTDRAHCGACGNACAAGQLCAEGRCAVSCGAGLTECAGVCRDLASDNAHCGACGNACAAGTACAGGACQPSCAAGTTLCDGACRSLASDRLHCGACDLRCAAGQICSDGRCQVSCGAGLTECAGVCRDLQTDRAHCGACGTACAAGQLCAEGRCAVSCGAGLTECAGVCRDLASDNAHCGACGMACAAGTACAGGACRVSCPTGTSECDGVCRDLRSDNAHCGSCRNTCAAGTSCVSGVCETACASGLTACAGVCRDLRRDDAHCGACGAACMSSQRCDAGRCVARCATPGPTEGLWGWWRFDGDLLDSSGNARHGFVTGEPPRFDADGQCGAVAIDPARAFVDLPNGRLRRVTLSARIRPRAPVALVATSVFDGWTASENVHLSMIPRDGRMHWQVGVHDNLDASRWLPEIHLTSTQPVDADRWTLVTLTYDGSALRLYVDGRLDAETAQPNSPYAASVPPSADYRLGVDRTGARRYLGLVDELRIYERALSAQEVSQLAGP